MSTPLEQKALLALRQYSLFTQGDRIAVGVSGGADSVALLRFLAVLREEYRWELIVCHIHHGLRGAEADRDEQFVRELAGQLGLPYAVRHIDAAALALENHLSVEEAGRNARYAFFAETAGEGGRIATAHTLDDTIETVLMNLIRGTGLHGLCGIPRIRGNIVRPLLDVTRAEVEEYLALLGQPYCTDSTNLSNDYTRNRVRHDILPRLRELNPNFTGAMARMLPQLAAQWGLTEQLAESAAQQLHMTQPAVTRAIQELESYYGVKLFERMGRRLPVTEVGKRFYSQAVHIVDLFDNMETSLRNWDALGVLRVGATIMLGNMLLPDLILRFKKDHPGIRVQVMIENGESLCRALLDNELDLALIEGGVEEADLTEEVFARDELVLILAPGHPLTEKKEVRLKDLMEYDLLLRERGSASRAYLAGVFEEQGLKPQPLWESASTHALVEAVSKGLGISLLPRMLVQRDIDAGHVCARALTGTALRRENHLAWHRSKFLTPAAEDFLNLCREVEVIEQQPS